MFFVHQKFIAKLWDLRSHKPQMEGYLSSICQILLLPHHVRFSLTCLVSFPGEEGEETEVESPKIYEPIGSFKELSDRLEMHQQQYNESIRGAKMDLVFFKVVICIAV